MPAEIAPPPEVRHPGAPDAPSFAGRNAAADASLLPAVLSGPATFLWLWALPIGILFALNVDGYTLIAGNLDATQRTRALWLGAANLANLLAGVALFFVARRFARREDTSRTSFLLRTAPWIAVQVTYLVFALMSESIVPRNVAPWIYSSGRFTFNQFSFAMLPLSAGVLQLACARARHRFAETAISIACGIGVPLLLYGLGVMLLAAKAPLVIPSFVIAAVTIVVALVLLLGLVRLLVLALRNAQGDGPGAQRMAVIVVALALPLAGLLLNRAIDFPDDFQSREVYGLTFANAAILLFAAWWPGRASALAFALLCATLPYSTYFFVVFLPYTPLAVFAVLFFGTGLLILAPTLLFVLHLWLLRKTYAPLRQEGRRHLVLAGVLSFLVLPGAFFWRTASDKVALDAALRYTDAPALHAGHLVFPGDVSELRRALDSHRAHKNGVHYPLISDFYAWWVFDHLILPDDRIAQLEQTFFGAPGIDQNTDPLRSTRGPSAARRRSRLPAATMPQTSSVIVRTLAAQNRAIDAHSQVLSLRLTLHNEGATVGEYVKKLPLPAGVFATGFELQVNGTPVPGRIFEKKTALWVYTMIRDTERRDPGVLFYNAPDELELRVFPIPAQETTEVAIDFLVPGDVALTSLSTASRDAAGVLTELGRRMRPTLAPADDGSVLTLGDAHVRLPAVDREPYLHVIVDRSLRNGFTGNISAALRQLGTKFPTARHARVTAANYDVIGLAGDLAPFARIAEARLDESRRLPPFAGGFSLDLALAHALREHRDADLDRGTSDSAPPPRPIFVVLTRDAGLSAGALKLTAQWADTVPALELHAFTSDGTLRALTPALPTAAPLVRRGHSIRPALANRTVHFSAPDQTGDKEVRYWSPEHLAWLPLENAPVVAAASAWTRAALLVQAERDFSRSPGDASWDRAALVKASRESGVLLPATSYIVVENAAQWRMLERSEKQKLSQHDALQFLETPAPSWLWIALGFLAWLGLRHLRRRLSPA